MVYKSIVYLHSLSIFDPQIRLLFEIAAVTFAVSLMLFDLFLELILIEHITSNMSQETASSETSYLWRYDHSSIEETIGASPKQKWVFSTNHPVWSKTLVRDSPSAYSCSCSCFQSGTFPASNLKARLSKNWQGGYRAHKSWRRTSETQSLADSTTTTTTRKTACYYIAV